MRLEIWLVLPAYRQLAPGTTDLQHLQEDFAAEQVQLSLDTIAAVEALINQNTVTGARYNSQASSEVGYRDVLSRHALPSDGGRPATGRQARLSLRAVYATHRERRPLPPQCARAPQVVSIRASERPARSTSA